MDLGKNIVIEATYDEDIQDKMKKLVSTVVTRNEVRHEVIQLVKDVFGSQEATNTLVDLLTTGTLCTTQR